MRAGLDLYKVGVYVDAGKIEEAAANYDDFLKLIPFDVFPGLKRAD